MILQIPSKMEKKVLKTFGKPGQKWLEDLPGIVDRCMEEWNLKKWEDSPVMSYSFIRFAHSPQFGPVVLKVGFRGTELARRTLEFEARALNHYSGRNICRLYDCDSEIGALLLERIYPGFDLTRVAKRRKKTEIVADLIKKLPVEIDGALQLHTHTEIVRRAFSGLHNNGIAGRQMLELSDRAEEWLLKITSNCDSVLLHADLNHWNILKGREGWKAIDPKGQVGPAFLEAGRFIINELNMMEAGSKKKALANMVERFSEILEESPGRIAGAAFLDKTLSLAWKFEEKNPGELKEEVNACTLLYDYFRGGGKR